MRIVTLVNITGRPVSPWRLRRAGLMTCATYSLYLNQWMAGPWKPSWMRGAP